MQNATGTSLQCEHLTKHKGSFILSDINFHLDAGYILGVIGRNGSGKTTLTRLLMGSYHLGANTLQEEDDFEGLIHPHESLGDIRINHISIRTDEVAYKEQIAYVLNETPFPVSMNAMECADYYGRYYKSFDRQRYRKLLKEFGVRPRVSIKYLSKGQQIKQQLAFALSYEAKVYILDEPTGNLDVEFREEFYQRIRELMKDSGKIVVYVSHLTEELEQLADYILWIGEEKTSGEEKKGVQRYFGSLEELKEQFQLIEAERNDALEIPTEKIIGIRERQNHQEMLVKMHRKELSERLKSVSRYATLKEIMYYVENI